jgi:MscS family membrane protein
MTPPNAEAEAGPLNFDAAFASMESFLVDVAKETPWLTEISFADHELWRWIAVVMATAMAMTIGKLVRILFTRAAKQAEVRSQQVFAVVLSSLSKSIVPFAFAIGLSIGITFLKRFPPDIINKIIGVAMVCALGYAAYNLVTVIDYWLRSFSSRTSSRLDDMLAPLVTKSVRAMVVILAIVQIVQVVSGMAPASLIAGLGVGGLAIGLAAQDTIKNIFGSVMIFSDRPFELGDEITVDGNTGIVETVGFRSTRFRTGTGHVITIPNGDLAGKAIINVSRRRNLSRTLNLPLPSDLPPQRIEQAIDLVKDILANHEGMLPSMPPKVVFTDITPTSLNLQVQYWFHPADGGRFNALNERVNFEILRRFQAAGIALAVPTQRVELEKAA